MRVIFKLLAIVAILAVVGAGLMAFGWQAEPFPEGSHSAERLRPGALPVASLETVFEDRSRPTARNGDYPGADSRRLKTTVWYPSAGDGAPYPLLVYSHGFSSSREGGAYLGQYLASRGFVVAALDFPLTNMYAPGGPRVKDVLNQPGDVSFVIDSVLSLVKTPGGPLAGRVDEGRIGVFGLSLGG